MEMVGVLLISSGSQVRATLALGKCIDRAKIFSVVSMFKGFNRVFLVISASHD
jgi:hypothetical protein